MKKFRRGKLAVPMAGFVSVVPIGLFRYDDTRTGANASFALSFRIFL